MIFREKTYFKYDFLELMSIFEEIKENFNSGSELNEINLKKMGIVFPIQLLLTVLWKYGYLSYNSSEDDTDEWISEENKAL